MNTDDDPVLLVHARTATEAKVIVAVLEGAGIQSLHSTGNLMDEFAMTQGAMNLQAVEVFVAPVDLERARAVLVEAQAAGKLLDDESPGPDEAIAPGEDPP